MRREVVALGLAFALQAAVVAAVPAHEIWIRARGTAAVLAVQPVDPYDPLRGYALAFRYDGIDDSLPGYDDDAANGSAAYVILAAPRHLGGLARPLRVQRDRPRGELALRIRYRRMCAAGIRRGPYHCTLMEVQPNAWYVDERDRFALAEALRAGRAVAELRIAPGGEASLLRLTAAPSGKTMGHGG